MTSSSDYQNKINRIKAYTTAYLREFYPEQLEEATTAARNRWNEEHPEDPWTGRPGRRPAEWKQPVPSETGA